MNSFHRSEVDVLADGAQSGDILQARDAVNIVNTVNSVMRGRKATRRFLNKPVDKALVVDILDIARTSPSNSNTQPWRVYAVAGAAKEALSQDLCEAHAKHPEQHIPCYKHFPDVLGEQYLARQNGFATVFYGCLGIERSDMAARARATAQNYLFFGAPVGFVFTIESSLERGSWLDYGMFLQNVMLAAKARGLDTCPQISFVKYHEILRRHLSIPASQIVVCGMSLGYADTTQPVNALTFPREPVETFTSFSGFDK